jgi:G3E family GTPase
MGHLDGIIRTIHSFNWPSPVSLASSIVLVDIPAWLNGRQTSYQLFWDQIHSGDILIGTKADRVTEDECDAWMDWAESIFPPKMRIDLSYNKKFKSSLLDINHTLIVPSTHEEPFIDSSQNVYKSKEAMNEIQRFSKKRVGAYEHGWIFPPGYKFDVSALRSFFGQMQHVFRAKGVFKTNESTYLFNAVSGEFTVEWVAYNKDSRLEIIALDSIDWAEWEQKISLCFI